jgi:hypothetical protein
MCGRPYREIGGSGARSVKAEDGQEGVVDRPHLLSAETTGATSQALTSTAPSCSTSTRVTPPASSTSGRNDAALARREVGATTTTERGNIASDCTTTP